MKGALTARPERPLPAGWEAFTAEEAPGLWSCTLRSPDGHWHPSRRVHPSREHALSWGRRRARAQARPVAR
ncbi:MAG: hypothetical protein KF809_14925 [Chloroflexi bacterium]|nr:hypothetical protein [Chloroflexota bacterium]